MDDFGQRLEQEKIDRLKELVDPLCEAIRQRRLSRREITQAINQARLEAACIIPNDLETYDLIYGSRLERLLQQFPPPCEDEKNS